VVSGVTSDAFGWRTVFFAAGGAVGVLAARARARLPRFPPTTHDSYMSLLASLAALVRKFAPLRRASLVQALLCVAFSGFWSTLAIALAAPPYQLGSSAAGVFGLAGAAGAVIAPLAGSFADKRGPEVVIRAGAALVVASFVAMTLIPGSIVVLA